MNEDTVTETGKTVLRSGFADSTARYFKAFLETGLTKDQLPAWHIDFLRDSNVNLTLPLNKYPQLYKNLYKNVASGFAQETFVISQNKYVTHTDDRITDVLARAVEALSAEHVSDIIKASACAIEKAKLEHTKSLGAYKEAIADSLQVIFETGVLIPMMRQGRAGISDTTKNDGMATQKAATQALIQAFHNDYEAVALRFYREKQSNDTLHTLLADVLTVDLLKRTLRDFLYEYTASDAYQEAYRVYRFGTVLPETSMYVFFGELEVNGTTFPLFYSEVTASHAYPSLTFMFTNRIHVNTHAISYALQQYSKTLGAESLALPEIEKIITIDPRKRKGILLQLQDIVNQVSQALHIDPPIQLDSPTHQQATNGNMTLKNTLRVLLSSASKDSIIADYEQILNDSRTMTALADFVQNYATQTPAQYVQEVSEEWDAKPITEKLIAANPLPLNDEQRKALIALNKPECNTIVIDGAPGTGKSHFISAVVAQSLSDGFSTLVLSNTSAALDTVQNKVTEVLREVRGEGAFHNPLLRLNRHDDELLEDIETQFIQKLQAYHQNYTKLQSELKTAKNRKIQAASDELANLTQHAENINLHEVEQTIHNESKFGARDWIQEEPVEEITSELQKLHKAIQYIRKSEANYLLPYIESSQQKAIAEFLDIVGEYEKASKNVNHRLPDFIVRYRKLLPDQKTKLQSALSYIHSNYRQYTKILGSDPATKRLEISDNTDFRTIAGKQLLFNKLVDVSQDAKRYMSHDKKRNEQLLAELLSYETAPEEIIEALNEYINQVVSLKSKIFGFSGRTLVVENLTRQLKKSIPGFSLSEPEKRLDDLQLMVDMIEFTIEQLAQLGLDIDLWKEVLHIVKQDKSQIKELQKIIAALVVPADFEFMANHRIYEADNLLANISLLQYATELNEVFRSNSNLATLFGVKSIGQILAKPQAFSSRFGKLNNDLNDVKQLDECKKTIKQFIKTYPAAAKRLGVNYSNGNLDIIDDTFAESSADEVKEYLAFKKKEQDITNCFKEMISDTYGKTQGDLHQIEATQLSHTLDTKFMKYIESQAENFAAIRAALKSKQQITPSLFNGLTQAFPCVLGTIRDYATYVPLKKHLFDVLIIDEASHITVAEALPALLRAKKVVIIGDEKQYANTHAASLHDATSEMFRNNIISTFTQSLQSIPADTKNNYIAKVRDNFDVSSSILQFGKSHANAQLAFTKYFRSSEDIISYVNKTFYDSKLKCLKARALPLKESIKFDVIDTEDIVENQGTHTSEAEAKYILQALLDMKESGYKGTIGILTPYFEQAALIQKYIDESVIHDWFAERQLKVMTFDTSFGESRDYVFYSMVHDAQQKHYSLFPEAGDSRVHTAEQQRLVVGLSRAASTIHFVLSKQPEAYAGELKNVLTHYKQLVSTGAPKAKASTTDILMAAESLIPQYFYATQFYKKHTDRARLVTQFSLGDLLKPLAKKYTHPPYKVDFMIVFDDQRIVITYDEFKENFMSASKKVSDTYLTAEEIYNQKELENYGYTFLRLNTFNLGPKPIETLDALLTNAVKTHSWPRDNGFLV